MVDGVAGNRSTYGVCFGVLGWRTDAGEADSRDLSGLGVALTLRYDDDEAGSPRRFVLYVDERAGDEQRTALGDIFLGRSGGPHILKLPWVRKPSELIAVRPALVELDADGRSLRVDAHTSLSVSRRADAAHAVTCGIPGYDKVGAEYYADELRVDDDPFHWKRRGNCAFATHFDYSST
jgi:hypothetical protein